MSEFLNWNYKNRIVQKSVQSHSCTDRFKLLHFFASRFSSLNAFRWSLQFTYFFSPFCNVRGHSYEHTTDSPRSSQISVLYPDPYFLYCFPHKTAPQMLKPF